MSRFNVSLIVRAKSQDSVHNPQVLKRRERRAEADQIKSFCFPARGEGGGGERERERVRCTGGKIKRLIGWRNVEESQHALPLKMVSSSWVWLEGPSYGMGS